LAFVKYEEAGKTILEVLLATLKNKSSKKYRLNKLKRNNKKNQ
jgi:hypothetical protein